MIFSHFLRPYIFIFSMASGVSAQTQPSLRPKECLSSNVTEDVLQDIVSKYPPWQRPVRNVSEAVDVNISFALSKINDIIEKDKTVTLSGYLNIQWFDQLRVWNDTFPFNCIAYIVVSSETVWLPDVAMMNGDGRYLLMNSPGEKVRIHSDGYTIYSPGGIFVVYCEFDLRLFPFDVQLCAVKFESWRYTHPFMAFRFGRPNVSIFQWVENEQWELIGTSQAMINMSYMEPENRFDRMEFYLCLKRKSQYYATSVLMPGLIIAICQVFALPLEDSNKINVLFTCLLAYLFFLMMIASDLPRSSTAIPLLTVYVCVNMFLIAFSILAEGVTCLFAERANSVHPLGPGFVPKWLHKTSKAIAKVMHYHPYLPSHPVKAQCASILIEKVMGGHSNPRRLPGRSGSRIIQKEIGTEIARKQWRYVARVSDRLTLLIYSVSVCLAPIIVFTVIPKFACCSLCPAQVDSP